MKAWFDFEGVLHLQTENSLDAVNLRALAGRPVAVSTRNSAWYFVDESAYIHGTAEIAPLLSAQVPCPDCGFNGRHVV